MATFTVLLRFSLLYVNVCQLSDNSNTKKCNSSTKYNDETRRVSRLLKVSQILLECLPKIIRPFLSIPMFVHKTQKTLSARLSQLTNLEIYRRSLQDRKNVTTHTNFREWCKQLIATDPNIKLRLVH